MLIKTFGKRNALESAVLLSANSLPCKKCNRSGPVCFLPAIFLSYSWFSCWWHFSFLLLQKIVFIRISVCYSKPLLNVCLLAHCFWEHSPLTKSFIRLGLSPFCSALTLRSRHRAWDEALDEGLNEKVDLSPSNNMYFTYFVYCSS